MNYYQIIFLSFAIFISYSFCIEEATFKVNELKIDFAPCFDILGNYNFYIEGEFTGKFEVYNTIVIDLISPSGVQAECTPHEKNEYSNGYFYCDIDICLNSLKDSTILLPIKSPKSDIFKFPNWEEVIGAKEGESNLVAKNVDCLPKESYTFTPSSLKYNGCSGNKNTFSIIGKWSNEGILPHYEKKISFKLDNEKKDLVYCYLINTKPNEISCEFDGEGDIKFSDKYFKYLTVCKLEKIDSSIHVDKCSSSSYSSYLLMNIIFLSLSIILLF